MRANITMDPRTGRFPSAHQDHQHLVQLLVDAGLIQAVPPNEENGRDFFLPERESGAEQRFRKRLNYVEWGYEIHTLSVTPSVWAKIVAGEEIVQKSRGAYEGAQFWIEWSFNCSGVQTLSLSNMAMMEA
ncbi:MAG: hypothetical protein IPK39_19725 [Sulfuritalea sp.]|nr:hypothetical protein [Sulfuritalea sp.]